MSDRNLSEQPLTVQIASWKEEIESLKDELAFAKNKFYELQNELLKKKA
jgi:hypothetical protein